MAEVISEPITTENTSNPEKIETVETLAGEKRERREDEENVSEISKKPKVDDIDEAKEKDEEMKEKEEENGNETLKKPKVGDNDEGKSKEEDEAVKERDDESAKLGPKEDDEDEETKEKDEGIKEKDEGMKEKEENSAKLGPKKFESGEAMFDYFFKLLHHWSPNVDINKFGRWTSLKGAMFVATEITLFATTTKFVWMFGGVCGGVIANSIFGYVQKLQNLELQQQLYDFNMYEYMVLLDLLKKGHAEADKKIGRGIKAFQVRYHPMWMSRCFFLVRIDGSSDDFSFRKCVDHILPLPENMKIPSSSNGKNKFDGRKNGGQQRGGGRGGGRARGGGRSHGKRAKFGH